MGVGQPLIFGYSNDVTAANKTVHYCYGSSPTVMTVISNVEVEFPLVGLIKEFLLLLNQVWSNEPHAHFRVLHNHPVNNLVISRKQKADFLR